MVKVSRLLLKREFITWLIFLLLLASIINAFLPEKNIKGSLYQLKRLNYFFLFVLAVVSAASLSLTLGRLYRRQRASTRASGPREPLGRLSQEQWSLTQRLFKRNFFKRGYSLKGETADILVFERHFLGSWGTFVFHLGLLFIVLSFIYRGLWGQRGYLQVMEGEKLFPLDKYWLVEETGLLAANFEPDFGLFLLKVTPHYQEDELTDITSRLLLFKEQQKSLEELNLKAPIHFEGHAIYQTHDYGFVATFFLRRGETFLATHYFLDPSEDSQGGFSGGGDFPQTGYRLSIIFYPNLFDPQDIRPLWPGGWLEIKESGRSLYKGRLFFSQSIRLGDDVITFGRLRPWTGLIITRAQGEWIFYLGLLTAVLGAALIYLFYPRRVSLFWKEGILEAAFWVPPPGGFPPQEQEDLREEIKKIILGVKGA
ncbi:cytochrome c biogenesis protein ResB [Thermosulfuriphilus sp.]